MQEIIDRQMMSKALQLAELGCFTTSPNPCVGCVLTKNNQIIGQGWHQQAGQAHAERNALTEAGDKAKGSTAYVTLEPCNHTGRTGPCVDALLKAGVERVVAAMVDPNPRVAGQGLARLAEHGVQVEHGLLAAQAERLNRGFCKRMRHRHPWIQIKLASSLDGKTALRNGQSKWITAQAAREDVQLHRAQSCAILSGANTVLADDPSLNVRHDTIQSRLPAVAKQLQRQPLRVIIDGQNRLSARHRVFHLAGKVLLVNLAVNPAAFPENVSQWQAPAVNGKVDLSALMTHLAGLEINNLWVEGGAQLAGALLQNNLFDELILYQAAKILGDTGKSLLALPEYTQMTQAQALCIQDIRMLGQDIKILATPAINPED